LSHTSIYSIDLHGSCPATFDIITQQL